MNRIVAVPNWSFFNPDLCAEAREMLARSGVTAHYCQGDIDHQRTVTAFSGTQDAVFESALNLVRLLLPSIDLRHQHGVHPRVGAMDVMPFVIVEGYEYELIQKCREWAVEFSREFKIPYHLYEKAALDGNESRLPVLRGQTKDLTGPIVPELKPNPRWGVSIIGVRDFLLATNVNVHSSDVSIVRAVAKEIRSQREAGNPLLQGVRALGFELQSRGLTQLSLNLTQPNLTSFDEVFEFAAGELAKSGGTVEETELIGVIRQSDVSGASLLTIDPSQVVT